MVVTRPDLISITAAKDGDHAPCAMTVDWSRFFGDYNAPREGKATIVNVNEIQPSFKRNSWENRGQPLRFCFAHVTSHTGGIVMKVEFIN